MNDTPTLPRLCVVIADDHPLLLTGFAAALANRGIDVVSTHNNPVDAVSAYRRLAADVLILDIRFGEGASGLDVALNAISDDPTTRVILLTQFDQSAVISKSYRGGVLAYITKDLEMDELVRGIEMAAQGKEYLPSSVAYRMAREVMDPEQISVHTLSERELEVLKGIAKGLTNVQIAENLHVSAKTVSNDSAEIKRKLRTKRTAALTQYALRNGLI